MTSAPEFAKQKLWPDAPEERAASARAPFSLGLLKNALASLFGQALAPLLALLTLPFYVDRLGLEGYGVLAFILVLPPLSGILIKGSNATLQREVARRSASSERESLRWFVATFEVVYWIIAVAVAGGLIAASDWISREWLQSRDIEPDVVKLCLLLSALRLGLFIPMNVYQCVFISLERQVLSNGLTAVFACMSVGLGVLAVLLWQSPAGVCAADLISACVALPVLRHHAIRLLPRSGSPSARGIDWRSLNTLRRPIALLAWTNALAVVLAHTDRITISRLMPLSGMAVYQAAVAGGLLLTMCCAAFLGAAFPRSCRLALVGSGVDWRGYMLHHSRLILTLAICIGCPIAFFADDVLLAWTQNSYIVAEGASVMALYVWGSAFAALAQFLYHIQIAVGALRSSTILNTVNLLWYGPLVWLMAGTWGLQGVAACWLVYCIVVWCCHLCITSRAVLHGGAWVKHVQSLVLALAVGGSVEWLFHQTAVYFAPDNVWARLLVAALSALILAGIGYWGWFRGKGLAWVAS